MRKLIVALVFCMSACSPPEQATYGSKFKEIHQEYWGSWKLYILQHESGSCFVAMWPNGEGAGAITQADVRVCGVSR